MGGEEEKVTNLDQTRKIDFIWPLGKNGVVYGKDQREVAKGR